MAEAIGNNSAQRLSAFVERIERLDADKRNLAEDIADIYKEAKSAGFDVPALRAFVKERRDPVKAGLRRENVRLLREALAGLAETPLGQAALGKAA